MIDSFKELPFYLPSIVAKLISFRCQIVLLPSLRKDELAIRKGLR